jgi:hypothetical protein
MPALIDHELEARMIAQPQPIASAAMLHRSCLAPRLPSSGFDILPNLLIERWGLHKSLSKSFNESFEIGPPQIQDCLSRAITSVSRGDEPLRFEQIMVCPR